MILRCHYFFLYHKTMHVHTNKLQMRLIYFLFQCFLALSCLQYLLTFMKNQESKISCYCPFNMEQTIIKSQKDIQQQTKFISLLINQLQKRKKHCQNIFKNVSELSVKCVPTYSVTQTPDRVHLKHRNILKIKIFLIVYFKLNLIMMILFQTSFQNKIPNRF